jgi:hypothetical protein
VLLQTAIQGRPSVVREYLLAALAVVSFLTSDAKATVIIVDQEYLERPRRWQVGEIGRFIMCIAPISPVFDLTTFALLWFAFGANATDRQLTYREV